MTIQDLEAFVAVVDSGTVVLAAERLHLSQSAVTRRIQSLEDSLGSRLLHRDARPFRPSAAGREVYATAVEVLASLNALKGVVASEGTMTTFRFGVSRTLGDLSLTQPINCLQRDFPKLELQATVGWSGDLVEKIVSRELDAAALLLTDREELPSGIVGERLGVETLAVIRTRNDIIGSHLDAVALSAHQWITNPDGCPIRAQLRDHLLEHNLALKVAIETQGPELQVSLVSKGLGMGYVLPHMLRQSRFADIVEVVQTTDLSLTMALWVAYIPEAGPLLGPIRCLRDSLRETLGIYSGE